MSGILTVATDHTDTEVPPMRPYYVAVDFDGTLVDCRYPDVGAEVPGAVTWLRKLQEAGASLILWTMRSGRTLEDAVTWCESRGIRLFGVNVNPTQEWWTASPKAYAHVYVDDAAVGCPLRINPRAGGWPMVDWDVVGPAVWQEFCEARGLRVADPA